MKITNKLQNNLFIIIAITILVFIIFKALNSVNNHEVIKETILTKDIKVILYTKKWCNYCEMAKEFFTKNQIAYEDVDLSVNLDLQKKLVDKTGQVTVPYIFINDEFIGGYSDLLKLKKLNKL
jgi:glutaredoxin 3